MKNAQNWCNLNLALKTSVAIGALILSAGHASAQDAKNSANANDDSGRGVQLALNDDDGKNSDITVTGTHIAGAESASPTYHYSQDDFQRAGQADLGEVLRSIPFNFTGGQNPGVMEGTVGIANANGTNAASANLRGLGPDATLTLLNGHRLPYNGNFQSIDVSSIPIAAVSSLQIVPDGASAVYGSDAVGGVVNIVLARDYSGIDTAARLSTTTRGGGFEQQYSVTGGTTWSSGGFMIAGQYDRQNSVLSSQRDFTEALPRPADLLPESDQYSILLAGHQNLTDNLEFSLDGFYNRRHAYHQQAPSSSTVRYDSERTDESYAISPKLTLRLSSRWIATATGTFGADEADNKAGTIRSTGVTTYGINCACNRTWAGEIGATGPVFQAPGGRAELAVGGGYREDRYLSIARASDTVSGGTRRNYYAYGEINVPLVSDPNSSPGLQKLTATGALRYEHYNDFGGVTNPRVGLIYAPVRGFQLKGSWGRSFKAPSLLQLYSLSSVYLYPAASMGVSGRPATASVLMPFGGNPNLKAERATNWSITADFEPAAISGLHLSASFFKVIYRDRVVQPINIGTALSDPQYAQFITYDPSRAAQEALISGTTTFTNLGQYPYDPVNVIAIAEDRYTNAARQDIRGVDVTADYRFRVGSGELGFSSLVSWIDSSQQIGASAPVTDLAGVVFNPPHFRARSSASWTSSILNSAVFVNYIGGVRDNRFQPNTDGDSMVTIDVMIGATIKTGNTPDRDLKVSVVVNNVFDQRPPYLRALASNYVNYDSTNYSALGRIVALSVNKKW